MRDYVYNMDFMDADQPLAEAVMRKWKSPRKPPWTIGYASTYAGNTWRKGAMERLMEVVYPKWKALGMVDEIVITQSNLDDSLQIQQMLSLIHISRAHETKANLVCRLLLEKCRQRHERLCVQYGLYG